MAWMTHGVVWADRDVPEGLCPHHRVCHGRLAAVLTLAEDGALPDALNVAEIDGGLAASIRRHDAVLSAYAATQDVLPFRFGVCVEEPADAKRLLEQSEDALTVALSELAGRKEYSVRVIVVPTERDDDPAASGGAAGYLGARLALRRTQDAARERAARFIALLQETLTAISLIKPLAALSGSPRRIAGWSCLMREKDFGQIAGPLDALREEAAQLGLAIRVTGPHAPFAFAAMPDMGQEGAR
ncbi:MAG: GvpL/GvpF family gas vesicle protein [Pseudomonadota bacterium]